MSPVACTIHSILARLIEREHITMVRSRSDDAIRRNKSRFCVTR